MLYRIREEFWSQKETTSGQRSAYTVWHIAYGIRCMPIAVPKNVMVLPQTVGFKAEAVDEEEAFDGWNAEWNRRVCDPREIRDRTLPDRKRKRRNLSLQ